jgi:hypothetical protein
MTRLRSAVLLVAGLPVVAWTADPPKPDWSQYVAGAVLVGEVSKAKDDRFTLVVTSRIPTGNRNNPFRTKADEYSLTFHENGLVRWKKLPPKLNSAGKRVEYAERERLELKQPRGAPGFAADRSALQDGAIVEVHLVRLKSIKPDVAVIQDYQVKYAIILSGGNPNPDKKDEKKELKKEDAEKKDDKKAEKKDDKKAKKKDK